jgi:hypothetical protein
MQTINLKPDTAARKVRGIKSHYLQHGRTPIKSAALSATLSAIDLTISAMVVLDVSGEQNVLTIGGNLNGIIPAAPLRMYSKQESLVITWEES